MNSSQKDLSSKSARRVLITGGAGFIGSHLTEALLKRGNNIVVLDNFNSFYDPAQKRKNIAEQIINSRYKLIDGDLRDEAKLAQCFSQGPYDVVIHLAAMAGVRPSLEQPLLYMDVNINGTQKLLDKIIASGSKRLVFGSSSSVYGKRSGEQFVETDRVDQPLSPYAASKAAGEMICYAAHHTHKLPVVCLRFFTVFGPRQRPDLAIHKFCQLIERDKEIELYGDGKSKRDYTFVDDIISGIIASMEYDLPGYDIINLGRSQPVQLIDMVHCLEKTLGKSAKIVHKPMPPGEMPYTYANIEKAKKLLGYQPKTSFENGVEHFVNWHRTEHRLADASI